MPNRKNLAKNVLKDEGLDDFEAEKVVNDLEEWYGYPEEDTNLTWIVVDVEDLEEEDEHHRHQHQAQHLPPWKKDQSTKLQWWHAENIELCNLSPFTLFRAE